MNNIERRERDAKILKMKEEGYSIREIGEAFGLCRASISQICAEQKKQVEGRSVQTAKRKGTPGGARFCYKCGADIRSEGIILAEKLRAICATLSTLPLPGDEIRVINQAANYIEEAEKNG